MRVTVLAPAFNEGEVIALFVRAVEPALPPDWELLVVDDGSLDETGGILEALAHDHAGLRVITHDVNRGVGAALATGFEAATGDYVITMDADLSHPLELLPTLVAGLDDADAVFASRYVAGGGTAGVPRARIAISRIANLILGLIFRSPVRDLTTGYRAYRKELVRELLPLAGDGYEAQLELAVRALGRGARVKEVPLVLAVRAGGESKMRYLSLIRPYGHMVMRLLFSGRRRV